MGSDLSKNQAHMDTEGRLKLEEQDCDIEPPPRKKLKARRGASAVPEADNMDWGVEDPSTQTLCALQAKASVKRIKRSAFTTEACECPAVS